MDNIIKISFHYKGSDFQVNYHHIDDGYDQINGALEYIADNYVIPDLIVAGKYGRDRKVIGKLNLLSHGISGVSLQLDNGDWINVDEKLLLSV
ncbi:TPA: hypothetical protein N5K87_004754 [Enterobacter asburiae]|nr:hypothetical protein [Klebsiella pneumoniae]HCM9116818.1 hypothetical protein [Enterobacter asburiae]HCM9121401.1 hypothetical protein [Enterobacter asburiae]